VSVGQENLVETDSPTDDIARVLRTALFVVALVGCAKGGVGQQLAPGDGNEVVIDGKVYLDGPDGLHDAHEYRDAHVFDDAHVYNDAHIYNDAHVFNDACVPVQTQLLINKDFDLGPSADWHEIQFTGTGGGELILASFPQSGAYDAWMGGYTGSPAYDRLFQDIAIPAGTTALVLTGYHLVNTQEDNINDPGPYDFGDIVLATTANTLLEDAIDLDNIDATTGTTYTFFTHSFATAGIVGTTVRLVIESQNDDLNATNFRFDTLTLTATHCP